jgi:hypothetical protein
MSEVQPWHAQNLLDVLCKSQERHVLAFLFTSAARPSYHPAEKPRLVIAARRAVPPTHPGAGTVNADIILCVLLSCGMAFVP